MDRYTRLHTNSYSPDLSSRTVCSPDYYRVESRRFRPPHLEEVQGVGIQDALTTRLGDQIPSVPAYDGHMREGNLLKQLSLMQQDTDLYPPGTPRKILSAGLHSAEHSGLQNSDPELEMVGRVDFSTSTKTSPTAAQGYSKEASFLEGDVEMKEQTSTLPQAAGFRAFLPGDEYLMRESVLPSYYGYRREMSVIQRALLASEAGESPEFIRAILMSETPGRLQDSQDMNNSMLHAPVLTEDWEARMVGKSQSMRTLSTFHEENEVLRRALNSIRRSRDHQQDGAALYGYTSGRELVDDSMHEARTMSMRELGRWMPYDIDVYSPMWVPERHRMYSGTDCGTHSGDGLWNRREEYWGDGRQCYGGITSNGTPLYAGTRLSLREQMRLARGGIGMEEQGTTKRTSGCNGVQDKRCTARLHEEQQQQQQQQIKKKKKKELNQLMTNSCKGNKMEGGNGRSESSWREEQCAMCGQRLWLVEGDGTTRGGGGDGGNSNNDNNTGLARKLCRTCHPPPPSPRFSNSPLITSALDSRRHGRHWAAATTTTTTTNNQNNHQSARLPPPPPQNYDNSSRNNNTISIACNPSSASYKKKKKTRIIELCKQLLGLSIKS